jgi:Cof subfamily protein (haloacid dehalogenase superfamily)
MNSQLQPLRHDIRLVIADVDGTLVTHDKVLTGRATKAVGNLRDADILFGVTSGRPPKGMKMLIDPLRLTEPMAGFNGGAVVNPDMTPILKRLLPPDVPAEVLRLVTQHGLDIFLYSDLDWFVLDAEGPHVAREAWTVQFSPTVVRDFDALLDRVVKIVGVSDDLEAVARCEKDIQDWSAGRVSAARSQPYYLDITHPKANKGEVVSMFSELCRIPASQIATIGDMPNDMLMFERSGLSIAMGNASSAVQESATFVTDSNEEEGFAKAIERLLQ